MDGPTNPLERLLVLQDHDIAIAQLEFRRAHLPELAERDAALGEAKRLMPTHIDLTKRRAAIDAAEKRVDDEVQTQRAKAEAVDTKLYSGSVSSPRELQALQADLDALKAHVAKLEDDELEQMTAREDLDTELAPIERRLGELQAEVQRCGAAITAGEADVDALLVTERAARAAVAATFDAAIMADYEARRAHNKGKGVARLVGDTCQACRLSIPATEVDTIRHDESGRRWYCDNCGAILVATPS